jgi:DNA modification methylase
MRSRSGFELQDIQAMGFEQMLTGFSADEIGAMNPSAKPALGDPDEIQAAPADPVTVTGDLWLLGKHRVLCGDSTDASAVRRLMADAKAGLLHADPPYGMGKEGDGIANDNLYREKLDAFQMQWWAAFRPFLDDNASAYIWGTAPDLWRLWYCGGLSASERMTIRNEVVWNKGDAGAGGISHQGAEGLRGFPKATERCLFFMLGEQGFNTNADNYWEGWEPIRSWLDNERKKSGLTTDQCNKICGKQNMTQSAFTKGGFRLILEEDYNALRNAVGGKAFKREYEDLKREYEDLKREYEDLKREFYATRAFFDNTHANMTDVWDFPRVSGEDRHGHATPKPVAMMERVMRSSLPDDGLCVEPFGGSGSTLIGAETTGRTCYIMELLPAYCDVIVRRWQSFTGQQATLEGDGRTFGEVSTMRLNAAA